MFLDANEPALRSYVDPSQRHRVLRIGARRAHTALRYGLRMTGNAHRADPTDEELATEQAELIFDRFDNDIAFALGMALVEAARAKGLTVTIDVRRGAQQVFHVAFPGTTSDNDAWVERKVAVVRRFEESSFRVGCTLRRLGGTIDSIFLLDPAVFGAHGGAFPITVRGAGVVGVVTVSGLPQREDHELVVDVLRTFLQTSS